MRTFSRFFFTILLSSGLISGFPTINQLESRTGTISQVNQEQHSKRSILTSSPHQSKRSLFRNKKRVATGQPGMMCDGRLYKQQRVYAVIAQACNNAHKSNKWTLRGAVNSLFKKSPTPYIDTANLFPGQRGLTQRSMSQGLLSINQARRIFGGGRNDFMVFRDQCTPVGIVRKIRGKMLLCAKFSDNNISSFGGNAAASPIVPTGPPGAGAGPGPGIVPTRPPGAVAIAAPGPGPGIVPTRPPGAVAVAAPGPGIVPTRPPGADAVAGLGPGPAIVPTRPPGAG